MKSITGSPDQLMRTRHLLRRFTRNFFDERGYTEVDAPVLVAMPGAEVHLDYFSTHWQDYSGKQHACFLRSSPEIHLKQAIAAGLEKVYSLGPCFRNAGEYGPHHFPEFTMLEWYEVGLSLEALEALTLEYLQASHTFACSIGLSPSVPTLTERCRMTVAEAFKRFAGVELEDGDVELAAQAKAAGVFSIVGGEDFETAYFKTFLDRVEPKLRDIGVCVLNNYPASQSVLAESCGGWSKRFEVYINGVELCNAFQELSDRKENERRLVLIGEKRRVIGKQDLPEIDPDFLNAIASGLPECAGNALGFDRWTAILLGCGDIQRAIPFSDRRPFGR